MKTPFEKAVEQAVKEATAKLYTADEVRDINNAFKRDIISAINSGANDFDIAALDIDKYLTK